MGESQTNGHRQRCISFYASAYCKVDTRNTDVVNRMRQGECTDLLRFPDGSAEAAESFACAM